MGTWTPITHEELLDLVRSSETQMDSQLSRLWQLVRAEFTKWRQHPWGDEGGGFWVVGIIGRHALWFNDIEYGFNWSRYTNPGILDEYWCDQDELQHAISRLQDHLNGESPSPRAGPPQPIPKNDV